MGDLHFLPYSTTPTTSLACCWDLQNLGFLNTDMSLVMDGTACSSPFFSSLLQSDFSTGYLEDALFEFSDCSKRRRFTYCNYDDLAQTKLSGDLAKCYWNENSGLDISENENFNCMSQITSNFQGLSDESMNRSMSYSSEDINANTEMKTPETQETTVDSSETKSTFLKHNLNYPATGKEEKKRKTRVLKRVVYPFALIKPGGKEGDMTLNDINQSILMPPTRPVRHPVGDFACRPCVSAAGQGLSGKAVAALTRIHTQGRGTITIIRTRG